MNAISRWVPIFWVLLFVFLTAFQKLHGAEGPLLQNEWLVRTWETEHGLPENSATAIARTRDGYLWFGTFSGLARFDGEKFKVFTPDNSPGLPNASIVNLHVDKRDRIWISTYDGIAVLEGDKWRTWGKSGQLVRTFSERANGDLLLTTFDGGVVEFRDGQFRNLPAPPGEKNFGYFGYADEKGNWWVIQHGFVGQWNGSNWVAKISIPRLGTSEVGGGKALDGGLWLVLGKELRKYKGTAEVSRVSLPELAGSIWSLTEDTAGTIWICTVEYGLFEVRSNGTTRHWTLTTGLAAQGVRCVFQDFEGNLWVGTSGGGLTRLRPKRFRTFGREAGLNELVIHSVSPAREGGAWIATFGKGLCRLRNGAVAEANVGEGALAYAQSVLEDRFGRVWVSTHAGLYRMEGDAIRRFQSNVTGGKSIVALFEDSRGQIWIGGNAAVVRYDGSNFLSFPKSENSASGSVRCFEEDRQGTIWMSNTEHVLRFADGKLEEVLEGGVPIRGVTCLKAGAEDTMWMGSLGRGLLAWRGGKNHPVSILDPAAGFPFSSIFGIAADKRGFLWMTSNRGVIRVEEKELQSLIAPRQGSGDQPLKCQMFDLSDGLATIECTGGYQPVISVDRDGDVWIATIKGVATINSKVFEPNSARPRTRVQEIAFFPSEQTNSRPVMSIMAEPFPAALTFPAGSHGFEFRYRALSLGAPEKVRYQIKLGNSMHAGQWEQWEDVENRPVTAYPDLKPGEYTFSVRAKTGDGATDETDTTLAFTVLPFFYETMWFRTFAGAVLVGVGWLAARYRIRSAETLQQTEKRMALAADLAHLGMWQWEIPHDRVWLTRTTREIFQFPLDTVGAQAFLERIRSLDRERVNDAFEHAMSFGASHLTFRLRRPEGPTRWITASVLVDFDRHQKPIRMIGVCMDVTERRNAEESARELSGRLIHAQEDERRRIARELHDDLNQRLAVLSVEIALVRQANDAAEKREQRLSEVDEQIKELASEVHKISYRLHPAKLDQLGLVAASRSFCRELDQQTGTKVEFVQEEIPRKLPEDVALCFYRVMQEALQNMVRHSRSPEAKVHLQFRGGQLKMIISDSGKGFDLDVARRKGGLGLISMNERVRLINGTFKIESQVGSGTRITIKVPLTLNPPPPCERQPDLGI